MIKEMLDETFNEKMEEIMSRLFRTLMKQFIREGIKTATQQQGPTRANTAIKTVNMGDIAFYDVDEHYENKAIRLRKSVRKSLR